TGYGYIRRGTPMDASAFKVAEFIEKPPRAKAEEYLAAGGFDWNAGLFLFKASRLIEEIGLFRPDVLGACQAAMNKASQDLDFFRVDAEAFARCPEVSVDYAVMEKTQRAVVVPMEVGWNDIGAFSAIWDILPKDEAGNVSRGDVLSHDSRNNLFFAENAVVAAVGVEDLIVVQTKDAILVASRHQAQEVKNIVARIKQAGRTEHQLHREVHRPWGKYDSVDAGKRYQVKRITVLPGGKLSVQMHHHRAEHWVVVSGVARVTLDGVERLLAENESIYLPIGAVHALENPGKVPLEIIEVQVGSYLGEDDIVRFEDRYGRK
ncbi:MAG: mannose-1-phosphate guanylyltransferase/mannose-6-phosphate isomerase, partial [Rhizobium sp.]